MCFCPWSDICLLCWAVKSSCNCMLKTANLKFLKMSELTQLGAVEGLRLSYESDNILYYQPSFCMLLLRPLFRSQSCLVSVPPFAFHSFVSGKGNVKPPGLFSTLLDHDNISLKRAVLTVYYSYQAKCHKLIFPFFTLDILSLLHWLTPLLTLTTHSTARFRACWTSSKAGTMTMLGMERVMFTLKIAWWSLLLPWLVGSLAASEGEKGNTHKVLE